MDKQRKEYRHRIRDLLIWFWNNNTINNYYNAYGIPNYTKIKEVVKKLHPRFSHFRLISWDFALDEDNEETLIEVNLKYGELDFHQLNNGPLFGNDTERILKEVFLSK